MSHQLLRTLLKNKADVQDHLTNTGVSWFVRKSAFRVDHKIQGQSKKPNKSPIQRSVTLQYE